MKIQYLGTGAAEGFPGMFCECEACKKAREWGGKNVKMRSCTLINDHILIDLSPDIFAQSLRWKVSLSAVDQLILTHSHEDHLNPFALYTRTKFGATILPDVPAEKDCVNIYGNEDCGMVIDATMNIDANNHRSGRPERSRISWNQLELWKPVQVGELTVIPLRANHKKGELCHIYVITDGKASIFYANDTGKIPEDTWEYLKSIKLKFNLVSLDCARGTLDGDGHMGLKEDCDTKKRLQKMGLVTENTLFYLNHFSHMCGLAPDEFQKLAEKEGMSLAHDGLILEV